MNPRLKKILGLVAVLAAVAALGYGGWELWLSAGEAAAGGYAIRSVKAKVTAGEENATVRLTIEMVGPGLLKESRVPVLPPGVGLIEAKLDGGRAKLDLVGDRAAIIVRGAGLHTAELVYALPLAGERRLSLALPRSIVTAVELELPKPGYAIQAPATAIVEMLPAAKGTAARIVLPPADRVDLAWFPKPVEVASAARTAARTETLYTIQGDYLAARTLYSVRAEGRDVSRLSFALPEGLTVDQVEGDWVKNWDAGGGKLLVQAASPLAGEHQLVVHHRRPLSGAEVSLEVPALDGAVRQWGFGAVAAGGAVELKELTVERGAALDPRGLPPSLASAGAAPIARAFRYDALPSKPKLALVRHPEMETLEATCDSLNLLLVQTADGRSVVKAVYSVRNARRQHLEVKLPKNAKVWSAYVAGAPVRPSGAEGGKVLVPLSCSAATASRGFAVELVYMVPGEALAAKGRFEAVLPEVNVPVMQAMVSVAVPEDLRLEDFAGSLRPVEGFTLVLEARDAGLIAKAEQANPADRDVQDAARKFREDLAGAKSPNVAVRFRNEALDANGEFQKAIRDNWNNRAFLKQYYLEQGQQEGAPAGARPGPARLNLTGFGQEELAAITGLASLSVAVPTGGRIYRFERQLLLGEGAGIKADYWSALAAKPKADAAVRLGSSVAALYRLSPRGLSLAASLEYGLDSGKLDALSYGLPAGATVLSVQGENVADWAVKDGVLEVKLVRPERSGGKLLVRAELPLADGEMLLAAPRLASAASEDLVVAIGAPADYEVAFPGIDGTERLAPRALPAALGADGREHLSIFRLAGAGAGGLRVKAVRHKELSALSATCDSVNAISFGTEEGVTMTRAIYEIRNVSQQHLELALPAGAKLWGAFVADRAVKPLAGEAGKVLLPLEVSADGQVRSYPVEVLYLLAGKAFARRGSFAAELPQVNVPVMHAMYSLYLPRKLRLADFGGSLKAVKEFTAPTVPALPTVPAGTDPKRSAALAEAAREFGGRARRYNDRQTALESNFDERDVAKVLGRPAEPKAPAAPGAAPEPEPLANCGLKLYIPAVGQMLRFERHLVVEGKLSVSCNYR